jgi:release factor glutamine methyltransferase
MIEVKNIVKSFDGKTILHNVNATFECSDLFEDVTETFDVIVSNPPYIPTAVIGTLMPEVAVYEPIQALDGKEDGLYFYKKIIASALEHLNEDGKLMFEIGYDQGESVSNLMKEAGYKDIQVIKDLAGNDRVVIGGL